MYNIFMDYYIIYNAYLKFDPTPKLLAYSRKYLLV